MQRLVAEAIGTFALVFAGTGAIVVNDLYGGAVTHVGIAMTFGLVVMAMVYAVGDISGAHLNPAVTLGFWLARRLPGSDVAPYVASQLVGALAASGLVWALFGGHPTLGATLPAGSVGQSLLFEIALTLLLMFTILNVATGANHGRHRRGRRGGALRTLRGPRVRRIDEPRALARPGPGERSAPAPLDLLGRSGGRGGPGRAGMPLRARPRVLCGRPRG